MSEYVPFYAGMRLGQGFNSYLQETRTQECVDVEQDPPSGAYARKYDYEEIRDYQSLVKSFELSAGAAVKLIDKGGEAGFKYLNKRTFEKSTWTFIVQVESEQQESPIPKSSFNERETNDPNEYYGDRYIAGFKYGGRFFARFSITLTNLSEQDELSADLSLAFSMYGANVEPSVGMRRAAERVEQSSEISVTVIEQGGGQLRSPHVDPEPGESTFLKLKEMADKFYEEARTNPHGYIRAARLDKYATLSDFNGYFTPFDYDRASGLSWSLLHDFIPDNKYDGGVNKKKELEEARVKETDKIKQKIEAIAKDPEEAETPVEYPPAKEFELRVYTAIKTSTFIVQRLPVGSNFTEYANIHLDPGAEKKFELQAFDFDGVLGSTVVSFGKSRTHEEYAVLIGKRISSEPSWEEKSALWVFQEHVDEYSEQGILVSRARIENLLRLQKGDPKDLPTLPGRPAFFFHVTAAT
ncbi:uncharacterized protein BDW43DRAFT_310556 [Aspergillus alliaceus]|uniref:uncharacterized protein n=1 Tax=Petromyces alliaceus TaxID=209559 RepID=UPI0012A47AB4|nr:uncharacterized protein BDW43DRAFT_310556 [Aspergillus alliaceus]KAB8234200.1 hypothetical protein BDW43DRAFT_310556 [Aspergillus alliaceus]